MNEMRDGAACSSLSDFDLMADDRLPNWGRVARIVWTQLRPWPYPVISSVYGRGKAYDDGYAEQAVADAIRPADWRDAETLDAWIGQLAKMPKRIICEHYYRQHPRHGRIERDYAVRALLDLIDANRAVNERMRELMGATV